MYSIPFHGSRYEAGGSIIHPANKYVTQLMKQFNLSKKAKQDSSDKMTGIYNGNHFVFTVSQPVNCALRLIAVQLTGKSLVVDHDTQDAVAVGLRSGSHAVHDQGHVVAL